MWLIDENLPDALYKILEGYGVRAQSASYAGFSGLKNGELTQEAYSKGFRTILTQDKTFASDAAEVIARLPGISIVVINIEQFPKKKYLDIFATEYKNSPIIPVPGSVLYWPR